MEQSISPGVVDTPMIDNSTLSDYLKQLKMLRPQDVTDAVVYVLSVSVGAMVKNYLKIIILILNGTYV